MSTGDEQPGDKRGPKGLQTAALDTAFSDLSRAFKGLLAAVPGADRGSCPEETLRGELAGFTEDLIALADRMRAVAELAARPKAAAAPAEEAPPSASAAVAPQGAAAELAGANGDEESAAQDAAPGVASGAAVQMAKARLEEAARLVKEQRPTAQDMWSSLRQLEKQLMSLYEQQDSTAKHVRAGQHCAAAHALQQRFRNLSEDLMDKMLTLDQLSGLAEEDRQAKKDTLRGLEALLEEVDSSKERMTGVHRQFVAELDRLRPLSPPPVARSSNRETFSSAGGPPGHSLAARLQLLHLDWRRMPLDVEFYIQEQLYAYRLYAVARGLDMSSLMISRVGGGALSVQGLCLPDRRERDAMVQAALEQLQHRDGREPSEASVHDLALQLGRGHFGVFRKEHQMPPDVEWTSVEPSFEQDMLYITLRRAVNPYSHASRAPQPFPTGAATPPPAGHYRMVPADGMPY